MGPKRALDSDLQPAVKLPKLENGVAGIAPVAPSPLSGQHPLNSDFSTSVKKKLASSTRTGQACDRCKVRKIRCDGRAEGCSPCAQNRTQCKTTDRITGRATTRGHVEATEAENNYLRAHIADLQAQVKELGAEPRALAAYNGFAPPSLSWQQSSGVANDSSAWGDRRASTSPLPPYASDPSELQHLPQFKTGSIGDNYLGVSSADSLLSHIKGTSLSVFGTEIDITDYAVNEEEYDKSVMSYNHFLRVALNDGPLVEQAPLPDRKQLVELATWYLRSLNPYSMLLDKPTFMALIYKIGNSPEFRPSPAETVCVHMMLATIKYQISVRNGEEAMTEEAHRHYRYALSFFKDLLHSHTWQDVQALTLICAHLRNFPKPGAAWIMCSTTFLLAVELGLHRSTKAWAHSMDKIEVEMRKRIFWTLHALTTNLSGKLGRPMPINMEDIDVEFPEPVNDCLPGEEVNLPEFAKCSFNVGIQTAKYTVWSSELYRYIYAVRSSPGNYTDSLRRLENGIQQWRNELPPELADHTRAAPENYIFALFLEQWEQEFQLLLHHPAVCRTTDPEVINSNLDKCLEASQKMLHNCNEMRKMRCLDIPWINTVVYIAAIFTILFVSFQRKDEMTSASMTKLRDDMTQWIDVIGECGQLLGSGDNLKKAISKLVEHSLNGINDSIVKRTATESLARAALQTPQDQQTAAPLYNNSVVYTEQYTEPANATTGTLAASSAPYAAAPAGASYPYTSAPTTSATPHPQANHNFSAQTYGGSEDTGMTPSHVAALAAATISSGPSQTGDGYAYTTSHVGSNGHQVPYSANGATSNDWRQWARTYTNQVPHSGDYLNTASTLMALGGREGGSQAPVPDSTAPVEPAAMQGPGLSSYQWPGMMFGMGSNGHVP
ncbi:hypothetical protein EJ04DRAFT_95407 [Polyplosphaeria fusca]|uniref:Zn(2)-C6 fungal-type domain-containing protein n=1 Tax=Polyplosphaeria fusca TaxID=682080 RepID=A0A9P4R6L2_9PLEO|nr:hypothetical protein EJ04DRAFT_95407 [Polyplosphaeria fusca]